ncbi:MAG: insulinase family protein, partial [Myxococcales bacterium]|nr:insulinase family protein [Myxococcales bacterium]
VYISTDRQEPSFAAWIAVRTGSRNDPADSTGLAHYLEHMLFKGSERLGTLDHAAEAPHVAEVAALYDDLRATDDAAARAKILAEIDAATQATAATSIPNEIDRVYAELGITGVNAFTSDEETVYVAKVPRNRLRQWAEIEADRLQHPIFRLFYPELEAVYEEKNISLDDPEERVWESTRRLLFPQHPYGTQTTIGAVDHLKTPAYGDMVGYFARWYAPNNVAVILAGDIDAATALPVLEEHFAGWAPKALPEPTKAALPPLKGRVFEELVAEGEQTVWVSWQTVDANHADAPALEVLDMLVDNAASGLLNVDLLLEQKVPDAASQGEALKEAGYWGLAATARDGQPLEEVEQLLLGVVDRVKKGDFDEQELAAIVLHAEIADKAQLESTGARVWKMAEAYILGKPWAEAAAHTERLRAVTKADVVRVAKRYLGDDRAVVYRRQGEHKPPAIPKPKITPVPLDPSRRSAFAAAIVGQEVAPIEPEWLREGEHYTRGELPAGPLFAATNDLSDLFSLSYRFAVGERRRPLLCYALELADLAGAGDLDAAALQRKLFHLGTTVHTSCDDVETTITITGIDRNLEASVALVDQWLRAPSFDDDTVKGLLADTLSRRKDALEEPDFVAGALAAYASRGKASPYLAEPSNKKLAKATGKQLARELRELPDLAHATLYFGPRAPDSLRDAAVLGRDHKSLRPRVADRYRETKRPTLFFTHKDVAQAKIQLVLPQPPLALEERGHARLFDQVLGGDMSGLIFQEIREARGLAYRAFARVAAGERPIDAAALRGYLGTQGDKAVDALRLMVDLVRGAPISAERFAASKTALGEDYRIDRITPRSRPWTVYAWERSGSAGDPRPAELATISGLDLEALRRFAGRFAEAPLVISLLGDRERVDLKRLGELAAIEEVGINDLVSYGPFPAPPEGAADK